MQMLYTLFKGIKTMNTYITMGLSGSGKTTVSKSIVETHTEPILHIELDEIKTIQHIRNKSRYKDAIFDGLFLNTTDILSFLNKINREGGNLFIIYFKPDKSKCLANDMARNRDVKAKTTIKLGKLEYPNIEKIAEKTKMVVTVIEQEVYDSGYETPVEIRKMPPSKVKQAVGVLESQSWSLGGTLNSYSGYTTPCYAEPAADFTELDNYLNEICPNITFLQYKRLFDTCVSTEEDEDYDYYGGCVTNAKYVCNINTLHEKMKEMGII